ncbi:MAG: hypothetical protein ACUVTC_00680 [Candidatus Bathycorpusculaceae bacterium]
MNLAVCGVNLDEDGTLEDLKKQLKKIGYSEEAIAEILKWYLNG